MGRGRKGTAPLTFLYERAISINDSYRHFLVECLASLTSFPTSFLGLQPVYKVSFTSIAGLVGLDYNSGTEKIPSSKIGEQEIKEFSFRDGAITN